MDSPTSTDVPSSDVATITPPSTEPVAPAQDVAQAPTQDGEAYWKWLADQDPDEVVRRHPRVQGKVGELADRQARRTLSDYQAEQRRKDTERESQRAAEERRRLREENPVEFAERDRQEEVEREQKTAIWRGFDAHLDSLFHSLPEAIQNELSGKQYQGETEWDGRRQFLDDINERLAEHKANGKVAEAAKTATAKAEAEYKKTLDQVRKEAFEAGRKAALGEANGSEPIPPFDGGGTARDYMTQEEFNAIRSNVSAIQANKAKIDRGLALKEIRY